jgi:tetratricopeptide (TPR) repeat protein
LGTFQEAHKVNPQQCGTARQYVAAYTLKKKFFLASKEYERALKLAIEHYEKVSKRNPKAVQPLMMVGMLYVTKKQPQKANGYYQNVLELNKNFAPAANNLAYKYAKNGAIWTSFLIWPRGHGLSPNDSGIADTLGLIIITKEHMQRRSVC